MDILLGCGHSRERKISPTRTGWIDLVTLDINQDCKPDVEWDLDCVPLPFKDNSAEEIHAYQVLEHCGRQGDYKHFFAQFQDFWRILKNNGLLCVTVPMPNTIWTWGDPGHTREINNGTIAFLDQDNYTSCGKTAMTDYRFCYKGHLKVIVSLVQDDIYYFVLKAIK